MSQENLPTTTGLKVRPFKANDVFLMLDHPFRRKILQSLATGGPKLASELGVGAGFKRHTYLKQFTVLMEGGFIVQKENPQDARKPLYALAPTVVACKTGNTITVDFGCCILRFHEGV